MSLGDALEVSDAATVRLCASKNEDTVQTFTLTRRWTSTRNAIQVLAKSAARRERLAPTMRTSATPKGSALLHVHRSG